MHLLSVSLSGLDKIHIGIGDNLSIMIQWISTFVVALIVGLYRQWQLALFLFIIIPFMALAAGIFGRVSAGCWLISYHQWCVS